MKIRARSTAAVFALGLLGATSSAFGAVYTFNTLGGNIPDTWNPPGSTLICNINVSGVSGDILKVILTLNDFAGNNMSNCRVDLQNFSGSQITLFDGNAPSATNGTYVFDDAAASAMSSLASSSGGTYRPNQSLSTFNSLTPPQYNGTWTVVALAWNGDTSNHFASATLEITTIPEPTSFALLGCSAAAFIVRRRR